MNKSELKQLIKEEIQKVLDKGIEATPANAQTIMSNLKNEKEGVYVLKGGLDRQGGWNEESLQKGKPLYYTTDTIDPKLELYKEDGMVWITIENGEIEVEEY